MDEKERRQNPRFRVTQAAKLVPKDADLPAEIMGRADNISEHGMRVVARRGLEVGTDIDVRFAVGDQILEASAEIVRATATDDGSTDMGIKFNSLSPIDQKFLEQYCRIRPSDDKNEV